MKFTYAQTLKLGKPTKHFHVAIPSLRRYDLLDQCIDAVLQSTVKPASILILDNGGSYAPKPEFEKKIRVITPGYNLGVPPSWNFFHRYYGSDDVYILNDDIFVKPRTFEFCQQMPGWFVTGFQFGCFCVRQLCKSCIGEFDEDLWPMYWEDYDYITRMVLELQDPYNTEHGLPYHCSMGGVVSAQDIPEACPINFELGAKSECPWMMPFKNRIRQRYGLKWGNNECGKPTHAEAYGGEVHYPDPVQVYWDVLKSNPNHEDLMLEMWKLANTCESVVELVTPGDPGVVSASLLHAGVKATWFYAPHRNPEWDIIPCLARKATCQFDVRTSFSQSALIPDCDMMVIGNADPFLRATFMQRAVAGARKYIVSFGPEEPVQVATADASVPWKVESRTASYTVYGRA